MMSADIKFLIATFAMSMVVFFGGMWIGWAMRADSTVEDAYDDGYAAGRLACLETSGFMAHAEDH